MRRRLHLPHGAVPAWAHVRGETKSIDAIHATSHDGDLWIVDDAKWPVVLRVETAGGDNYCELQSISAESIEAAESALD